MIVSEQQARTKWCPFSRAAFFLRGDAEKPVQVIGHGANRVCIDDPDLQASMAAAIENTGATRCLGSGCMAWKATAAADRGYCGLVGRY